MNIRIPIRSKWSRSQFHVNSFNALKHGNASLNKSAR